jgi:hypothetical protein
MSYDEIRIAQELSESVQRAVGMHPRRHETLGERRLDPEVFWQGVREDFACANRDEAMEMLREQQREEHGVEALELIATEDRVILGIRSTHLQEIGACRLAARSSSSSHWEITTAGSSG